MTRVTISFVAGLVLGSAAVAGIVSRYDVIVAPGGLARLDRWTGEVVACGSARSCDERLTKARQLRKDLHALEVRKTALDAEIRMLERQAEAARKARVEAAAGNVGVDTAAPADQALGNVGRHVRVEIDGLGVVPFPGWMSEDQITSAIEDGYLSLVETTADVTKDTRAGDN